MTVFVHSCVFRPNGRAVTVYESEHSEGNSAPVAVVICDNRAVIKLSFHLALREGIDESDDGLGESPSPLNKPVERVEKFLHSSIFLIANSASISPAIGGT